MGKKRISRNDPTGEPGACFPSCFPGCAPAASLAVLWGNYNALLTYCYYKLKELTGEITIHLHPRLRAGCCPGCFVL